MKLCIFPENHGNLTTLELIQSRSVLKSGLRNKSVSLQSKYIFNSQFSSYISQKVQICGMSLKSWWKVSIWRRFQKLNSKKTCKNILRAKKQISHTWKIRIYPIWRAQNWQKRNYRRQKNLGRDRIWIRIFLVTEHTRSSFSTTAPKGIWFCSCNSSSFHILCEFWSLRQKTRIDRTVSHINKYQLAENNWTLELAFQIVAVNHK